MDQSMAHAGPSKRESVPLIELHQKAHLHRDMTRYQRRSHECDPQGRLPSPLFRPQQLLLLLTRASTSRTAP